MKEQFENDEAKKKDLPGARWPLSQQWWKFENLNRPPRTALTNLLQAAFVLNVTFWVCFPSAAEKSSMWGKYQRHLSPLSLQKINVYKNDVHRSTNYGIRDIVCLRSDHKVTKCSSVNVIAACAILSCIFCTHLRNFGCKKAPISYILHIRVIADGFKLHLMATCTGCVQ